MASRKNDVPAWADSDDTDYLYEQAIRQMRLEIARGRTYRQACRAIASLDRSLKEVVESDFLKIVIAEKHFGDGSGLDDIALMLDLPYETVAGLKDEMLEEVGEELAARYFPRSLMTH